MSISPYDKLSKLDEAFLAFETPSTYMHVALTGIFEAGHLADRDGAVNLGRIRAHIASRLHLIPRYRQRLAYIPLVNDAVWIDDDHFDLGYHIRHASLPRPGNDAQLQQRVAEILERPLSRSRPLWEIWIIEGLDARRFALLAKVHHCMVDGVGGVELLAVLLGPNAQDHQESGTRWEPRPAPGDLQLFGDELVRRAQRIVSLGRGLRAAVRTPGRSAAEVGIRLSALASLMRNGVGRSAVAPFNGRVGPHRRIAWHSTAIDDVAAVRERLGGTVNDIVLTTVAGGLRRYLMRRSGGSTAPALKVAVPVNVRARHERDRLGNRASAWIVPLPVDTADPRRRLVKVRRETDRLKAENHREGAALLTQAAEWTTGRLLHAGVRLISSASAHNLIVTNVPGPPGPLYLLGARLLEAYPHLPLFEHQGLGIAVFSYRQRLHWGLTADWDLLPDPSDLVADLQETFAELCWLAGRPPRGYDAGLAATEPLHVAATGAPPARHGSHPDHPLRAVHRVADC
jgi:WS/DGAT/MGAT family acyltransferase